MWRKEVCGKRSCSESTVGTDWQPCWGPSGWERELWGKGVREKGPEKDQESDVYGEEDELDWALWQKSKVENQSAAGGATHARTRKRGRLKDWSSTRHGWKSFLTVSFEGCLWGCAAAEESGRWIQRQAVGERSIAEWVQMASFPECRWISAPKRVDKSEAMWPLASQHFVVLSYSEECHEWKTRVLWYPLSFGGGSGWERQLFNDAGDSVENGQVYLQRGRNGSGGCYLGCSFCRSLRKTYRRRVIFEGCVADPLQTIMAPRLGSKKSCLLLRIVHRNALSEVLKVYTALKLEVFLREW